MACSSKGMGFSKGHWCDGSVEGVEVGGIGGEAECCAGDGVGESEAALTRKDCAGEKQRRRRSDKGVGHAEKHHQVLDVVSTLVGGGSCDQGNDAAAR